MKQHEDITDETLHALSEESAVTLQADEVVEAGGAEQSALSKFTRTEGEDARPGLSFREIMGGDILTGEWFRSQIGLIVLCVVFSVIYITNRYSAEQEIIEIENLRVELQEMKYRALTRSGELTERSRQSNIEEQLRLNGDSTLRMPLVPPYVLLKPREE